MVNWIWFLMIFSGIMAAAVRGDIESVTRAALEGADNAVKISFGLVAIITFWLGVMKLAEEAGLVRALAALVRPLMSRLFPSVPPDHPAIGAVVMNLSANILGLGNAATPVGLIAMRELQNLNGGREVASEAMCTFLALNTSCVTIIPTTVIGIRLLYGSANPTEIVGPTVLATAASTIVAVVTDRFLRGFYARRGW